MSKEKKTSGRIVPRALTKVYWIDIGTTVLYDDAAGAGASISISINGCRVDGLGLGGVGCEGEERSEGVHCCMMCVG